MTSGGSGAVFVFFLVLFKYFFFSFIWEGGFQIVLTTKSRY